MNISGISKAHGFNNLGFAPNGSIRYLQPSKDISEIEKKLANNTSVDDLTKEEYLKLGAFNKAETAAFYAKVNKEMSQAEKIAVKIAKGEKLTSQEEQLISEKYPDLKREATQALKEAQDLKNNLSKATSKGEKQQLIATSVSNIGQLISKNVLAPIQGRIKLAAIENVIEKYIKKDSIDNEELILNELKQSNIKRGSLIDKKV